MATTQGALEQIPVATFIEDIDKFMVSLPHPHNPPQMDVAGRMGGC
jgi:hypothetical protein